MDNQQLPSRALKEMFDKLLVDRDLWKEVAESLAAELGKKNTHMQNMTPARKLRKGLLGKRYCRNGAIVRARTMASNSVDRIAVS